MVSGETISSDAKNGAGGDKVQVFYKPCVYLQMEGRKGRSMKYIIEFELPDNDTVLNNIGSAIVQWSVWGYSGWTHAKPVRHGHWRKVSLPSEHDAWRCSECGELVYGQTNYCHHCGADMGNGKERT